jgi:hypothetical protein
MSAAKIVKVSQADYDAACKISEEQGCTLGAAVTYVRLIEKQGKQDANERVSEKVKEVRLPNGRLIQMGRR